MDDRNDIDHNRSPPRKRSKTVHFPGEDCDAGKVRLRNAEPRTGELPPLESAANQSISVEHDAVSRAVVFFQGMRKAAITLYKDYMAKACEMVTFQFDSSHTVRLFGKLLKMHFEKYDARNHVRDWVAAALNVSTDMGVELHLCRPWRDFGFLKGATTPLRDAGYDLSVILEEVNWLQVPDQFVSFLKAMSARAVTGEQLDDTNLQFQYNLIQDIARTLVDHSNRFIRY
ncbi:hypothetical protein F52700_2025 [Fusarium sp. NRRL 52700]|nr:hypothetical protein F52700_2025 [Fusarium sp. NRRL 52700]